jgi:hypothetical protein
MNWQRWGCNSHTSPGWETERSRADPHKATSGSWSNTPYVPGMPIEEVVRKYGLSTSSSWHPMKTRWAYHRASSVPCSPRWQNKPLPRRPGVQPERRQSLHNSACGLTRSSWQQTDGLIRELCVSYLEDDDEVIVSRSSFPVYDISASVMRATVVNTAQEIQPGP